MSTAPKPRISLSSVFAGLLGTVVGLYVGANLVIPALVTGVLYWITRRSAASWLNSAPALLPALTIQAGHLAWIAVGTLLLGAWSAAGIDVVLFALGLTWLWLRPGLWPVSLLLVFQAMGLVVNTLVLLATPVGVLEHRALALHVVLRLVAIGYLWQCGRQLRNKPGVS